MPIHPDALRRRQEAEARCVGRAAFKQHNPIIIPTESGSA